MYKYAYPTTEYDDKILLWVLVCCVHLVGDGGPRGLDQCLLWLGHLRMETPVESATKCDI